MRENPKRAPTIRDVARECGRSHMTVSNVLNNRGPVSEATRMEVLDAMRRLNFRPNAIARGLNRKPMNTLGIILPDSYQAPTAHPYYSLVLDGVMDAAIARRADVIVYTGSLWTEGSDPLHLYRDGRSDGLIVVSHKAGDVLVALLNDARAPFVCVGDYYPEEYVSCVCVDDAKSEREIVEYLIRIGHRRIAMLSGESGSRCVEPRETGYRTALQHHGITLDEALILPGGFEESTVRPRVEQILRMPPTTRPTAICTTNDQIALVALAVLKDLGVQVPGEISVAGFDDVRDAAPADLTTMRQPIRRMASHAVTLLAARLSGQATEAVKELFAAELVVRGSTGAPELTEP